MQHLLAGVKLLGSARIDPTARLCVWSEQRVSSIHAADGIGTSPLPAEVVLGAGVIIGGFASLYEGAVLDADVIVEDQCRVGPHAHIGPRTRLCYGAHLSDNVTIGADCVIAGFVCDGAVVKDGCRVFGALVHEQSQPHRDWWAVDEAPPRLLAGTVVGWGATVIGDITVGPNAYIAAGAIVTKNVPAGVVVTGVNKIAHPDGWLGKRLGAWISNLRGRK